MNNKKTAAEIELLRAQARVNVKIYHNADSVYLRSETYAFSSLYLCLDLEMNPGSGKIIQVGYTVGDIRQGVICERGCYLVNPNEPLCVTDDKEKNLVNIVKLTKITEEKIKKEGLSLFDVFLKLKALFVKYPSLNRTPLVWGGDDSEYLFNQLSVLNGVVRSDYCFSRHSWDVKCNHYEWCVNNEVIQYGGLAPSMGKHNLLMKGQNHNAMWDSFNTFTYKWYLQKSPQVTSSIKEVQVSDEGVLSMREQG